MIFKTTILDINGKEWSFEGETVGRGMYDDNGDKSGFVIEDFNITHILLTADEEKRLIEVENINLMPDGFSEREIRNLIYDAKEEFLNDWMEVQDCAHDLSTSQKLV